MSEARAIQYGVRQSARKMRLVIDLIRGRAVSEAYAILRFSKKYAAKQIHKVLKSAVANAEQHAQKAQRALDVDKLRVKYAVVNEGQTLKRWTSASMGRATPWHKRTSHVEIRVGEDGERTPVPATPAKAEGGTATPAPTKRRAKAAAGAKTGARRGAKKATKAKKAGATKKTKRKKESD
jgi:large subunit ribosomal protein L22